MASDLRETEPNAIEEVFEFYHDSGDELNTDEEEDGNFYDGYLDHNNVSRSLTPSPNVQDEEFHEDADERVGALALPAQLEDRLHSIQSKQRSRSGTVTLGNMYGREPGNSDSDAPESEDEDAQSQSSGSSDWEH